MSLYYVQKLIYNLNRDPDLVIKFQEDMSGVLAQYELTTLEMDAIRKPDIGLLYVSGVNGQLLMHYAALRKYEWDDYIQAMKDGLKKYGNVKVGYYSRPGGVAV